MIKTTFTPDNSNYNLVIPNNYIGKKIEVIFYAVDEVIESVQKPKKNMADFWGTISDETAKEMHKELEESRNDWEVRLKKQF
jgi:hypothetical protein